MPLNPVPNWPASLDSLPDPTQATYEDDDGFEIDLLLQLHNAILEKLESKAGISESSAQDSPVADTVLASSTTGKSKWRKIVSADITDGTIATADMAANAVTQSGIASGVSTSASTTSTSLVDMTDMSVTLTTGGGDLLVFFMGQASASAGSLNSQFGLRLDSGADSFVFLYNLTTVVGGVATMGRFTGVAAGSHTVKARYCINSGTVSMWQAHRTLIVVELKR